MHFIWLICRLFVINVLLIFAIVCILGTILVSSEQKEQKNSSVIQKSIGLVGIKAARLEGLGGQGVKVGIIDTGIDYKHQDLLGYGQGGKVVGGYNFVNPKERPMDTDGHGTEVAGIIAGNGSFMGVAPESKLLSYKVSSTGEGVSSDYIANAVQHAIDDGVNVINISLGINRTNDQIDEAIDKAVKKGIVVVVAAGNNGPHKNTIGSPGKDINAITVGASYNNLTSSIVSTFEVGNRQYQVIPMIGIKALPEPIIGKIVYGGYGRIQDLKNVNATNAILLEERGSDIKGQKVYFSEKEENAANKGAKALVIFNNNTGLFFGELVGQNKTSKYVPRIPVISISKEDGLEIKSMLTENKTGRLRIFYHPNFVAPFSSRGPVSPFYIKPDLIAPGVFVNSTTLGGKYNLTSGTSIAAPHVAGAAALVLEKHPGLSPTDVSSILITTTDPVTDAYERIFPIEEVGSGMLNITRALSANLITLPHSMIFDLSYDNQSQTKIIHMKSIDGKPIPHLEVSFSTNESTLSFNYHQEGDSINVKISDNSKKEGNYEGFIILDDSRTVYRIPVVVHVTKGTLHIKQNNGALLVSIDYPGNWTYAKISMTRAGTDKTTVTSITPKTPGTVPIYEKGKYWVLAQIKDSNKTEEAYQTVAVDKVTQRSVFDIESNTGIPFREISIIAVVTTIAVVIGIITIRGRKN